MKPTKLVFGLLAPTFLTVFGSFLIPVIINGVLGFLIGRIAPMSWYARPYLAVFLFVCPAVAAVLEVQRTSFRMTLFVRNNVILLRMVWYIIKPSKKAVF